MTHPHRSPDAEPSDPRSPGPEGRELTVQVNGEEARVSAGATLASLIEQLGLAGRKLAVAIGRDVVPRQAYAERTLSAGDRIEILEAVGGG